MALTGQQEVAAALVAADRLSDRQIIVEIGVKSLDTLYRWKRLPHFEARVAELREHFAETVRARGIAILENRVAALDERWGLMRQVIAARAADETMTAPGHETGLLVRTWKTLGHGEEARVVEEYEVDTGLLRELREHERQSAQELGQSVDRKSVDGNQRLQIIGIEVEE